MKELFIYTKDEKTRDKLLANGFTLMHELEGTQKMYVFANNGVYTFSDEDKKNIILSKQLYL